MGPQLQLVFKESYSFIDTPNIFKVAAGYPCVYLWGVQQQDGSYLIHYIGQTQDIKKRSLEHLQHILSLDYGIFEPNALRKGQLKFLWQGFWRLKFKFEPWQVANFYVTHSQQIVDYIRTIRIFPSNPIKDTKVRLNIEGHLARYLKTTPYVSIYPLDTRTGISQEPLGITVKVKSLFNIKGLPPTLSI